MKLSIIVPVYNVERYIKKCIISLLNQDLANSEYEIIIINDGTKDNSIQIVKELQHNYSNIVLFSQENKGLGAARNYGITKAKGEYIWFVDSDDWIEPNIIATLYKEVKQESLDCIRFAWKKVNISGEEIGKKDLNFNSIPSNVYNGENFIQYALGYSCYACMFWFKKNYLETNNFRFTEGVFYEDVDAIPTLILSAKKAKFSNIMVYNYYIRETSIVNSFNPQKVNDLLKAIIKNYKIMQKGNFVLHNLISHCIIELLRMVSNPLYKNFRQNILAELKTLNLQLSYTKRQYFEVFIYNISPRLLLIIYTIFRLFK